MSSDFRLRLKFWGVRGSIPTPQQEYLTYGGNTACLEIRLPDNQVFIFDAGSGARNLGLELANEFQERQLYLNLFLTHFHWDHIQGIPFFLPLYRPENRVTFHSFGHSEEVERTLKGQMSAPYFPLPLDSLPARKGFLEIGSGPIKYGNLTIQAFPLNHPQGALGYRIESEGAVIVYATDLEHGEPKLDSVLRDQAGNADILIYDAQYTPEEYVTNRGWGHSHWLEATRVARDARVEQLILFHHDPSHHDQVFPNLVQEARLHFENTLVAQEGWVAVL